MRPYVFIMNDQERLLEVARRLEAHYGPLPWRKQGEPLDILILTILSQNTNDGNRDRAYGALRRRYPSYQAIAEADPDELAQTIQVGGLHRQKSRRIQEILRTIYREQGAFDLSYLAELSREEALKELLRFKGVGKKTAGIVLTFSLNKPYFPVDTHIKRITRRLELVRPGEDPHEAMNRLVPDKLKYQLHLHLIRHGRDTCRARKPACARCVIAQLCPWPGQAGTA